MFEQFNFHQTQLEYIKGAEEVIPTYRPFGKTPVQVGTMITNCAPVRDAYLEKLNGLNTARGEAQVAVDAAHAACVSVFAIMKSIYATDGASMRAIRGLPRRDTSAGQTFTRTEAIAKLWSELPNPPGSATAFVAGTLTLVEFQVLLASLSAKRGVLASCEQQFQLKEGALHVCDAENVTFITGALVQGRAQFPPGTAAREVIDAIPTEANTPVPSQALIVSATSPASGTVRLEFTSAHATSFTIWHKGPGEAIFSQVGESPVPGLYEVTGLAAGEHVYEVVGRNSRGDGLASAPATVPVVGALPEQPWVSGESQAEGAVHLWYGAEGATSFQVWHKGPGEPVFTQVDTTVTGEYVVFGLVGGMHAYKAVGVNAAGAGPASEPLAIDVAAVAVA